MDIMETMERTLHTAAQTGPLKMHPPRPRKMRWPKEFKAPIEAALHLGTPKGRDYRTRPPCPGIEAFRFFG
jgi:hypothetical protein